MYLPWDDGVHGVAPLVLDDVEVSVADAAEEHLDRDVAVPLNPEIVVKQSTNEATQETCISCPTHYIRTHRSAVSYNTPYLGMERDVYMFG